MDSTSIAAPRAFGKPLRLPPAALVFALLAAAPLVFALATWNPSEAVRPQQHLARFISLPVVAVEVAALYACLRMGGTPLALLRAQPAWVRVALAALAAMALGTAWLVAPSPGLALVRTATLILHLFLGLSLASLFSSQWREPARYLWPILVAGTLALLPIVAAYVAAVPHPETFDWENFRLAGSNVRQLGFYSAVGGAAAIGLAAGSAGRRPWALWTLAAALMLALSFWTGTRSSLLAVGAGFAFGFLALPALRTMRALAAALGALVLGALLSLLAAPPHHLFGLWRMFSTTVNPGEGALGGVGSGRTEMWLGTLRIIGERPFFGYGAGQFRYVVPESGGRYNHPHNLFLQVTIETGVVGAILFFALAGYVWWRFQKAALASGLPALPAFLAVNSLIALSMIEGALYHPWPVVIAAVGLASVLGQAPRPAAA